MNAWLTFSQDLIAQMPLIWLGLANTLLLAYVISVTGLLLGILVLYLSVSRNQWVRRATKAYISFFIGMPLIVLLFLMYYGAPQFGIKISPFFVAVIGFTLNVAAYNAAYMTTAYNGLDLTELEAARAQGFSEVQVFRLITLPQVLRTSIPALTNQVISNIKDSSIAFLIQYTEFFARVQELASSNFQFFKAYLFAALVYLALVSIVVLVARVVQKRLGLSL
ncbi:MAG: amino acid ABC transporter permease [Burkholderiales bacterium]|jgi:polar amino acid transport system permease protein|nr:amino acid ABC transporter permease [Burkholderiales bacterium]